MLCTVVLHSATTCWWSRRCEKTKRSCHLGVRGVEQVLPQTSQALHVVRRGRFNHGTQWTYSVVHVLAVKKILSPPTWGDSQLSIQNDASNVSGCLQPCERIIPSRGRAWRASNFKVFNGLCSSVTTLRLAQEHVSRRAAEEPRCFLLSIQVYLGSQHICKSTLCGLPVSHTSHRCP